MGTMKRGAFKVGPVSRQLISVDRLRETGHGVILAKNRSRIVNKKTGEIASLRMDGGMFILDVWIWVPTSCMGELNLPSEDLVSPRSDLVVKQVAGRECKGIMSHDEDILTLNGDGEAVEEEVECELEDESVGPTCAWRLRAGEARPSPITRSDGFCVDFDVLRP